MSRSNFLKQVTRLSALAVVLVLANCGKAQQPVPQIAPPPTGNNNNYGGGGGCGGATGVPIAPITSSGFMYGGSLSGYNGAGTMGLNVYSADQYYSQNVTGNANINLQTQTGNLQFCATSAQLPSGMITPGQLFPMGYQMYRAAMTLWQQTYVPIYWNGQTTTVPAMAEVQLPQVQLGNARVSGQVTITIRVQGGQTQYYQLQSR